MAYDRIPGIDETYNFNPQVRQSVASSNEVKAVISNEVGDKVPGVVSEVIATDPTVVQAASDAVDAILNGRLQAVEADITQNEDLHLVPAEDLEYAIPFVDSESKVAGGFTKEGHFNLELPPTVKGQGGVSFVPVNPNDFAYSWSDEDGYVAFGIRKDGTIYTGTDNSAVDEVAIANVIEGLSKTRTDEIYTFGDSLTYGYFGGSPGPTEDSWPSRLSQLTPTGVTVTNLAVSGYTIDEESVRVGALPVPLTVVGGVIPTTGPVSVTTTAAIGFRPIGTVRTFTGSVAGVSGVLRRESSNSAFTFTRDVDGPEVVVPNGTLFKSDYAGHNSETLIIMLGRNDVSYGVTGPEGNVVDHVVNGIRRFVDWHTRDVKRIIVMSVTTTVGEISGSSGYDSVVSINERLKTLMSSKFVDIRRYLIDRAIYDLGITPTSDDLYRMERDTLPSSIMDPGDGTHYSKATAGLVAEQIYNYLNTRGWIN